MKYISVTSEIGKLNRVMLHRPSSELESITPNSMARLLFDDIPYLKIAQIEHDLFAEALKKHGVEVVYLENYLQDILANNGVKAQFISDFVEVQAACSEGIRGRLKAHYSAMPMAKLIEKIFAGVRKDELPIVSTTLADMVSDRDKEHLFWIDPLPNSYFTRDPGAAIGCGLSISSMCKRARQAEPLLLTYIHKHHPLFKDIPLWYNRDIGYSIEGGDELVLSKEVVAIGCSERSSINGIEIWARKLLTSEQNDFKKVLVIFIPKSREFMHLDTVFTMVDYDKFTIHADAVGPMPIYEVTLQGKDGLNIQSADRLDVTLAKALKVPAVQLLKCGNGDPVAADREQWNDGSNTLAISPGVVVVYERNYVTNELLVKSGIKTIEIPSAELSRGRGGPRCMSMPLHRDEI